MAPSAETLTRLSGETGHQPATLEKVVRLLEVLEWICRDEALAGKLALKGGTALNLFLLDLARLSVDIDLNYVGETDRDAMSEDRPNVEAALEQLLESGAYAVRSKPESHAGRKWFARYESPLGQRGSFQVDINYMYREPLFGVERLNSIGLGGNRARDVTVLDRHEIIAGKLVALVMRNRARDLFDAKRLIDLAGIDWNKVRVAVLALGACGRRDWRKATPDWIHGDVQDLRGSLAVCVPENYFDGAGGPDNWIKETVAFCRDRLAPYFDLTEGERAFFDAIEDRGEIEVSGLDADESLRTRIARMPALVWKCQNRREWLRKGDARSTPIPGRQAQQI